MNSDPPGHLTSQLNSFELPKVVTRPLLDIRLRRSAETVEIQLCGDLDLSTVQELWETVLAVILTENEHLEAVAIDLSRLNYVDSAGLGCFVSAKERCARADIRFLLSRPDPVFIRLLQIAGLGHAFDID